jgi:PAS domain S-box-containing protein
MDTRAKPISTAADLRRAAEARLGGESAGGSRLVHELQVHQIELEMQCEALAEQNVELLIWRANAERERRELIALDENRALDLKLRGDALSASEEKFARIFRLSPDAINLTGLDDGIIYECNHSFAKLYGYTMEEAIGRTTLPGGLGTWVSREDRDRFLARLEADGEVFDFEVPLRRKDGTLFVGLISSALLEMGGKRHNLSIVRDVTRQRRMDEIVRKISVAVEQSPVTIVITDTEGRIEYVNPKFTELTGYSGPEVLGQNPRILKSGEMAAGAYAALWATIRAGEIWKGELHNKKKNGELFWEAATIAPIKDTAGAITNYVAIKEDITGRKRTEQMLQQLNEDLENRIRGRTALLEVANAELDAFSYSVSHDLRAPLRGIDGFSQALLEECGDHLSDTARHYLERVRAGTQRMGRLIDDLLKLSRVSRSSLSRQRLDLSALARSLLAEIRQGDPGRTVDIRVEPGLTASGDLGLVRSVLENLLGNAWKYSAKVPAARIELFREVQPDGLEAFCVRDNGAGFDMAYAGKLFSAFQRLHSTHDFEGTGIGLAIVQRIVRRHGGQIWATGAVDRGATFSFTLPEVP